MAKRVSRHLWIGNLPERIQEDELVKFFERFGRVQSAKLLKEKEPRTVTGTASPAAHEGSKSATVAFIDIKSANKAHAAQHTLDGRTLKTDYYDSVHAGDSSSTGAATASAVLPPPAKAVPVTVAPAPLAATDNDDRSHGPSQKSSTRRTRRSPSSPLENEGLGNHSSNHSDEEAAAAAATNPRSSGHRTFSQQQPVNGSAVPGAETAGSHERTGHVARRRLSTGGRESTTTTTTTSRAAPEDRERNVNHIPAYSPARTASSKLHPGVLDSCLSANSRASLSRTQLSESGSPGRDSRGSSPGSQENASVSSSGQRSVFETLSPDKRPLAICVRNLPARSSDSSLKDGLFHEYKKYGKIVAVKVQGSGPERHGIICFKRPEDVEKACDMSKDKKFFGASVQVSPRKEPVALVDADYRLKDDEMDEYHPKATRTLYVGDLAQGATAEDLKTAFDCCGEILDVDIKRQATGNSFAFVQFSDIESVVKVLRKMDDSASSGDRIRVASKVGFGKSMATSCIWCGNLPDKISDRHLMAHFVRAGPVRYCTSNREKGQGLVFFENADFAQTALTDLKTKSLQGRRIQMDYASRELESLFFTEMERSGQMTMEKKSNPFWDSRVHNGSSGRTAEREPFHQFVDARVHLNNRSAERQSRFTEKQRSSRYPASATEPAPPTRARTFPAFNADRAAEFDDSYERELRDYGFSQRERRSEKRSGRSESPEIARENGHGGRRGNDAVAAASDADSVYSERSEHSSNRRFFRHFSRSPSGGSVDSAGHRRRSSAYSEFQRKRAKDYSRGASSSSPISPSLHRRRSDSDGSNTAARSPPVRREPGQHRQRHRRSPKAEFPETVSQKESRKPKSQKRRRQQSGPHTPEMDRAVTPEEPPPDSPIPDKTTDIIRNLKPGDSVVVAPLVAPAPSSVAELVVAATADSNTPEVSSSKEDSPSPSTSVGLSAAVLVHSKVRSEPGEMGSDVVTSTVNHATSPSTSHADDPSVHSSTESENFRNHTPTATKSIVCVPMPEYYQLRKNKRADMTMPPSDLPLPEFAYRKIELEEQTVQLLYGSEVPTPPSSPRFKPSFHDRMKALDEKFEKISSVSVAMSQIKNRSVSVGDAASAEKPALTKRGAEFMVSSAGHKTSDPVKQEPEPRFLPKLAPPPAEMTTVGPLTLMDSGPSTSTTPVSNIARYTANPKLTVRSLSSTAAVRGTSHHVEPVRDIPETKPAGKPMTFDISAKILSITAEASAKLTAQHHHQQLAQQPPPPAVSSAAFPVQRHWNGKTDTTVEPKLTKQDSAKSIFFSSTSTAPVKAEDSHSKTCVDVGKKIPPQSPLVQSSPVKSAAISPEKKPAVTAKVEPKSADGGKRPLDVKTSRPAFDFESTRKPDQKVAKGLGLFGDDPNAKVVRKGVFGGALGKLPKEKVKETERADKTSIKPDTSPKKAKNESLKMPDIKVDRRGSDDRNKSESTSSTEPARLGKDDKDSRSLTDLETDSSASAPSVAPRKKPSSAESQKSEKVSSSSSAPKKDDVSKEKSKKSVKPELKSEAKEAVAVPAVIASKSTGGKKEADSNVGKDGKLVVSEGGRGLAGLVKSSSAKSDDKSTDEAMKRKLVEPACPAPKVVAKEYQQQKPAAPKDQKTAAEPDVLKKIPEKAAVESESKKAPSLSAVKKSTESAELDLSAKVKSKPVEDESKKKQTKPPRPKLFSDSSSDSDEPLQRKVESKPTAADPVVSVAKSKESDQKADVGSKPKTDLRVKSSKPEKEKKTVTEKPKLEKETPQKTTTADKQLKKPLPPTKQQQQPPSSSSKATKKRPRHTSLSSSSSSSSSSTSSSDSESRSPSPAPPPSKPVISQTRPAKKVSDDSDSDKSSGAPPAGQKKRGRKKKVLKSSSDSDATSDSEPPKKNIFEVSLRPEDLNCSMYDKIKRRACTKPAAPPVSSLATGGVTSRQASVAASDRFSKESSKKGSPPPRLPGSSTSKKLGDGSGSVDSSMSDDEEEDRNDAKYHSQSTRSSPDSDFSDTKGKQRTKRKSPPKKKLTKPVAKTLTKKSATSDSNDDSSTSSSTDLSELEEETATPKKAGRGRPRKSNLGEKTRRPPPAKSANRSPSSDSSGDLASPDRKPVLASAKGKDSQLKKRPPGTPEPVLKKSKFSKMSVKETSAKEKKNDVKVKQPTRAASTVKSPAPPENIRSSPEKSKTASVAPSKPLVDDHDKSDGFGTTYNLSLLMQSSFMENASRESSVASPAAALTPKSLSAYNDRKAADSRHGGSSVKSPGKYESPNAKAAAGAKGKESDQQKRSDGMSPYGRHDRPTTAVTPPRAAAESLSGKKVDNLKSPERPATEHKSPAKSGQDQPAGGKSSGSTKHETSGSEKTRQPDAAASKHLKSPEPSEKLPHKVSPSSRASVGTGTLTRAPAAAAPPREKTPDPVVADEPPVHDLEEEMIAAQNLQLLLDEEPSKSDPIIHIPETEDSAETDELDAKEAEMAAAGMGSVVPEPAPVAVRPEVTKSTEQARTSETFGHHNPAVLPPSHGTARPFQGSQDHQQVQHQHNHEQKGHPSAQQRHEQFGPLQPAPAPLHVQQQQQQQQPSFYAGHHRVAADTFAVDEQHNAKRLKRSQDEEQQRHQQLDSQTAIIQPALTAAGHQLPGQQQQPRGAVPPNFPMHQQQQQQQQQEQHMLQQRQHQDFLQLQNSQMGLPPGGMPVAAGGQNTMFRQGALPIGQGGYGDVFPQQTVRHEGAPGSNTLDGRMAHQQQPPSVQMPQPVEVKDKKSKKRKASVVEDQQTLPQLASPQMMDQQGQRFVLQPNAQMLMQQQQHAGPSSNLASQQAAQQLALMGLNPAQLQNLPVELQQQLIRQHQLALAQHQQQQQQQQNAKNQQPQVFAMPAHMRAPSVIPGSTGAQVHQQSLHSAPGGDRQNMHSAHQQQASRQQQQPQAVHHKVDVAQQQPTAHHAGQQQQQQQPGVPSPAMQQKAGGYGQQPSPSVPHSPQGMQPSPQMHQNQGSDSSRSAPQKPAPPQQQQQQQQQQQHPHLQRQNSGQPSFAQQGGSAPVPVIVSSAGRHQLPAGIVMSTASGPSMLHMIPVPQQVQQQSQKDSQQSRPSAIQSTPPAQGHRGSQQQVSGGSATMIPPSTIALDASQMAFLHNLVPNGDPRAMSSAIARLLQNPHHLNLAEHHKDQQQGQNSNQQQHHVGRPEPIHVQQQMDKSRAQQEANLQQARQNTVGPAMLRPASAVPVSFAGMSGMGMEVPNAFLPQLLYGALPYGFSAADLAAAQQDGRLPMGMPMDSMALRGMQFRPSLNMPAGMPEQLSAGSSNDNRGGSSSSHRQSGSEKADQTQVAPRGSKAQQSSGAPQMGGWPSTMQHGGPVPPDMARMQNMTFQPEALFQTLWHGTLSLKNDHAFVGMYFLSGGRDFALSALPRSPDASQNVLKIVQRMRLEPAQLESVHRRMQLDQDCCILLACATGTDANDKTQQTEKLNNGFVTYLQQKQAAGIVTLTSASHDPAVQFTVHVFPPCDFSRAFLDSRCDPTLAGMIARTPHLLVVIALAQ